MWAFYQFVYKLFSSCVAVVNRLFIGVRSDHCPHKWWSGQNALKLYKPIKPYKGLTMFFFSKKLHPDGPRINELVKDFFENLNPDFDYPIHGNIQNFGSFYITAWAFKNAGAKLKSLDPEKGHYSFDVQVLDADLVEQLLYGNWYWTEEERKRFMDLKSISYRFKFPESLMCDYDIADAFESVNMLPDAINF